MYIRQNPEKTFIALRMLSQAGERFHFDCLEKTLVELLDFAESSPEMVEWDEVDEIFSVWMHSVVEKKFWVWDFRVEVSVSDKTGRLLADIFRGVFTPSCYLQIS